MIDHLSIKVSDVARARAFYEAVFGVLGLAELLLPPPEGNGGAVVVGFLAHDETSFWIEEGQAERPPLHIAFRADDRGRVDAFHAAALAAGGRDNGAPGLRPSYHAHYYGAFVLDPDGNNVEAVCHGPA